MKLSVCVCTRNRPDDLRHCLLSIQACGGRPHQVIVSDDGDPTHRAADLVAQFGFAEYQQGPHRGLGANRNACLRAVTGSHVLFIDDDVTLPPDFLARAATIVGRYSDTTIVSGIEFKHMPDGVHRVEPNNSDFWGIQKVRPRGVYSSIVINATIFPHQLFKQARFDEQLRYGSEELDMARHAVSLGYRIVLEPELWVDHFPSPVNRQEYRRYVDASRMYATAKAYWRYEKKPWKALGYGLLAPFKECIAKTRREGVPGALSAVRATMTAAQYALAARHT